MVVRIASECCFGGDLVPLARVKRAVVKFGVASLWALTRLGLGAALLHLPHELPFPASLTSSRSGASHPMSLIESLFSMIETIISP
jgi:hypothetical protein